MKKILYRKILDDLEFNDYRINDSIRLVIDSYNEEKPMYHVKLFYPSTDTLPLEDQFYDNNFSTLDTDAGFNRIEEYTPDSIFKSESFAGSTLGEKAYL